MQHQHGDCWSTDFAGRILPSLALRDVQLFRTALRNVAGDLVGHMRTNEDRAVSHLLRSRHDPRLTGGSLDRLKGGETGNRPETGRADQSSPKVGHENTPPRLRRVTYQLALLVVILNLLVYNIPVGVCGCRAAPSDAPESAHPPPAQRVDSRDPVEGIA